MDSRPLSREESEAYLRIEVDHFADGVELLVNVPLNENQFGALVSFSFNVGLASFKASTLRRRINAEEFDDVTYQLSRWKFDDGVIIAGLIARREAEAELFHRPVAVQLVEQVEEVAGVEGDGPVLPVLPVEQDRSEPHPLFSFFLGLFKPRVER